MPAPEFVMEYNAMRHHWAIGAAVAAVFAALSPAIAGQEEAPATAPEQAAEPRLPLGDLVIDEEPSEAARPAASESAAPAAASAPVAPPSAEERTRLAAAMERGRLLFELAAAAQMTTRDMLERLPDPAAAGVAGWVAERDGNALDVVYYADGAEGPEVVYRGRIVGGRIASSELFAAGQRPPLSATQRRMAAARAAVAGLEREPCAADAPFNVFVVPPPSADAAIDVYKLTPQTQRGRFPIGGHYRATVAPDGTVASSRAFTNRCLDLEAGAAAAGTQPAPVAVTHLLDPLPTEIHVMLSLWSGRPLLVATGNPDRLWTIGRGRIGLVGIEQAQRPLQIPPPGPGR
jgi:hypothetical protein